MIHLGVDQSMTGTGVVVIDDSKELHDTDRILFSKVIVIPTDVVRYCKHYDMEFTQLEVYREGLIDEVGKNIKKVADRTKADKELFKMSLPDRIYSIIKELNEVLEAYPNIQGITIEGIVFAATGQISSLARLSGYIEHWAISNGLELNITPATTLKKFATGYGNADKDQMMGVINDEIFKKLCRDIPAKNENDVCDAYHLAEYAHKMGYPNRLIYKGEGR